MLYNQLLEPISTEATVATPRLSTPPYTPHDLQSSIKTLIPTPLLPPTGRSLSRRQPNDSKNAINVILKQALATRKMRVWKALVEYPSQCTCP